MTYQRTILLGVLIGICFSGLAQNPFRYEGEVKALVARNEAAAVEGPILFVGSSSFRLWETMSADLGDDRIINNGFGGSHFSDLIYYMEELVFAVKPKAIFIYEGDNDLGSGKSLEEVMDDTRTAHAMIRDRMPEVPVYFVSPKPSISRAHKSELYITYNLWLGQWAKSQGNTAFVDVWSPMMLEDGSLDKSLFIEDDLHMNARGYAIWIEIIKPLVEQVE